MKTNKLSCVGSDKMLFCMTDKDYEMYMIDCGNNKILIHEATILMTKRFHRASMGFNNNSKGEGATLFMNMESKVGITDIFRIMCCLQHSENTIDKMQFVKDEHKIDAKIDDKLKEILQHILNN